MMTRNVTLVLLGAGMLSTCCCLVAPPTDETHSTGHTGTHRSSYRRRTSWWPVFLGGVSSPSPSRPGPASGGPGVSRGGFGGGGHSATGGG